MNIFNIIALISVSLGLVLAIFAKETSRKRYIGWLIIAATISIFGICDFIDGKKLNAIFDIGIGLVDYYLAYFWYGIYRKAKHEKELKKLNDREKFLREIKEKKW